MRHLLIFEPPLHVGAKERVCYCLEWELLVMYGFRVVTVGS